MKLIVRVKPNSRIPSVAKLDDGSYQVLVRAIPEKGKANYAVITALAQHFHVARSLVNIVAGHTARTKIVEVQASE